MRNVIAMLVAWLLGIPIIAAEPLKLHPDNPHYLLFRGKSTVLIGSSEHYGAVINRDFNYVRYLDTLQAAGLNVTRVFSGTYRERPGPFGTLPVHLEGRDDFEIVENTLAPNPNAYIAPWPRSQEPGAADGLNKFDLGQWNPEYFTRLKDFVHQASLRGIVVELSLFSPYYVNVVGDHLWQISPWNRRNNVSGVGDIDGADALTLKDAKLLAVQSALVRKLVTELQGFDNVYYEICNEPHWGHVALDWQQHIARLIVQTEAALGVRHLILQEFADLSVDASGLTPGRRQIYLANGIEKRLPEVSLLAFHNSHPRVVTENYALNKPIGDNESVGLYSDAANRITAWRILLAGGAFHHGTDYSFTRGHEDGSFTVPANGAGGGSVQLRQQLGFLRKFMDGLAFVRMTPAQNIVISTAPAAALVQVLADAGRSYAAYISHESSTGSAASDAAMRQLTLRLKLPRGHYVAEWVDTTRGVTARTEALVVGAAAAMLVSPPYAEDIALRISAAAK